ncbi:uncharacterized protein BDW70DRAFT_80695 [Aspergillus foveolatus]|uniref:uncharacterized protein n=1 Tax=Aspergillus foveolatus TaxID=210207 RepID=UPI003CCCDCD1
MAPFIPPPPSPDKPGSLPPDTGSAIPIPISPPPWTLRARSWTFLYTSSSPNAPLEASSQNPNNAPEVLQSVLPPGAYHPFETIHASALQRLSDGTSQFQETWLKAVMIVRYEETDVGPYDELIFIPGRAANPKTGKKEMRISNIYVSTDASVWNGRRNWNIPKHRARFEFMPIGADTALRVYYPENSPAPLDPKTPFFTVLLRSSSLPKLPLPRLTPLTIAQPPLAKSRWPPGIQDAVIATDDPEDGRENPWLKITPSFKGRWGLAYAHTLEEKDGEETLQSHGDGVGFPKVKLRSLGGYFEGEIGFGIADIVA